MHEGQARYLILLAVLGGLICGEAFGQPSPTMTPAPAPTAARRAPIIPRATTLGNEFLPLRDRREVLERGVRRLEAEIQTLEDRLNAAERATKALREAEAELKEAQEAGAPQDAITYFRRLTATAKTAVLSDEQHAALTNELADRRAELQEAREEKDKVENEMNLIMNLERPQQDFKKWMSFAFAGLVFLVILGFFYVARIDEHVRRSIFTGTAGIQFLTLFSVVIAIILFGITGILQDKELAALLGGLSGYILGRVTTPPAPPSTTTTPPTGGST